jgi:hypothetical protein
MIVNNIIDDNIIEYNVPDRAQDVDFGSGGENDKMKRLMKIIMM